MPEYSPRKRPLSYDSLTVQRIILISGYGGSGKSTCAELLWNHCNRAALVPVDHLFHVRPFEITTSAGRDRVGRIKLRNSIALITTFLEEGFDYVIVDGLVWSEQELRAVEEVFGNRAELFLFWLHANKETRFQRAYARGDPGDDQQYLEIVENVFPYPWPLTMKFGKAIKIDVDHRRPGEIVDEILKTMATDP